MGQSALFQNCKEAEVGALREALKLAHADIAGLRADAQRSQRASSELHHRLNNSFQLLCGSLRLQERSMRGGEAADAIARARYRIAAVGRVHAFLLRGDKVGALNLGPYITDLCEAIATSLDCPCAVEAEDCEVGIGMATSVGTIVNELVINAAKHAGRNGLHDRGIRVQISRNPAGHLVVIVADSGPGMPQDFDISKSPSLGLRIVTSTVAEMGGTLSIGHANGAVFTIVLPLGRGPGQDTEI